MLDTKKKLKDCLKEEKKYYISGKPFRDQVIERVTGDPCVRIWRYQKALRYTEYYSCQKGLKKILLYTLARRRKNRLGLRLGIEISEGSFGEGLIIFHTGNIVVNGYSKIGRGCLLHGDNCIGNNGITEETPRIGDRVDIGVGAKTIGGIELADDIVVGAGAVVNRSFLKPGMVIAGVPAREIHPVETRIRGEEIIHGEQDKDISHRSRI